MFERNYNLLNLEAHNASQLDPIEELYTKSEFKIC